MKKSTLIILLAIATSAILFSFTNRTSFNHSPVVDTTTAAPAPNKQDSTDEADTLASQIFDSLKLADKGLSLSALQLAVRGYLHLQQHGVLNSSMLSIVDLSQSSREKRFYLIDLKNSKLLENTYVAHGRNSGLDSATEFSNAIGSEESSLGFYVTKNTYTGKHGYSLKIEGLDSGFNDNAEQRSIVVHAAPYVNAGRVQSGYMGRSEGCPALPVAVYKKVISKIKNGSTLFIYYPNQEYLSKSTVLNNMIGTSVALS